MEIEPNQDAATTGDEIEDPGIEDLAVTDDEVTGGAPTESISMNFTKIGF